MMFPFFVVIGYAIGAAAWAVWNSWHGQAYAFLVCSSVVASWAGVAFIRNHLVDQIVESISYKGQYSSSYVGLDLRKALPSQDRMVFSPLYWHLWTTKQWLAWLARRGHKTEVE